MEEEEEEPEELWNAYTTVKGLSISISGLKEGKRYRFRVAAKNIMGMSLFTETREPIEIKEQMCKLSFHINVSNQVSYFLVPVEITNSNDNSRCFNMESHSSPLTCSGAKDCDARDSKCQSRS